VEWMDNFLCEPKGIPKILIPSSKVQNPITKEKTRGRPKWD
jgi:hypothetical protein